MANAEHRLVKAKREELRDRGIRTFAMTQYLTGYLEGVSSMDDLPPQIQDAIAAALDKKAEAVGLPLVVVLVVCDCDHDKPDDDPHRFYLHVVASEIVAARARH